MTTLWYDKYGYYTYEQVLELIDYVSNDTGVDYPRSEGQLLRHLTDIRDEMNQYKMKIYKASTVIGYDLWRDSIIDVYKVLPLKFTKDPSDNYELRSYESVNTAPNFREGICCEYCKYYKDETGQDEMAWGVCKIHTTTDKDYEPNYIIPLTVNPTNICDDYSEDEDD
jgi:hypothetical protein